MIFQEGGLDPLSIALWIPAWLARKNLKTIFLRTRPMKKLCTKFGWNLCSGQVGDSMVDIQTEEWTNNSGQYFNIPISLGTFYCFFVVYLFFCKINFFEKFFRVYHQSFQTFWIQIRPDILSGLIWIQTVCNCYYQTTLVGKVCLLFDLILYVPSTIFQLNRDGSSWVEPVLS